MKKNGIVLITIGIICFFIPTIITGRISLIGISTSYLANLHITDYAIRALCNISGLCFIAFAFDYK